MLWYNSGTVAVTLNNKTVTGTGTAWLANVRNGDAFRGPDGSIYLVENVATDRSLTINPAYGSASGTGRPYAIMPVQGYQRDLADKVLDLISSYGVLGTAAYGTLTENDQDSNIGRVTRVGDWGLGRTTGLIADSVIQNNIINGFYRSGTGTSNGKPINNSGAGYIKFGWSGSFATYLYGDPVSDTLWFQNKNNSVDGYWREVLYGGHSGLGRNGADHTRGDLFPGTDLSTASAGAGIYYVPKALGDASDLPFDGDTDSYRSGTAFHRWSGTRGAQIFISTNGLMAWRGRGSSTPGPWRHAIARGDFGFGGAQAVPTGWEAQKTGWYYKSGTKPTWGGGAFFLDLAYNTTYENSGLRISTDPYSDRFYMYGAVSGSKEYRPACELWHDKNTTVDSNGFVKKASPVITLAQDGIETTNHLEVKDAMFERLGVGHYLIKNVPLLSRDGWYIETPRDRNSNIYFTLDYDETVDGQLEIRTYEPDYSDGPAKNGEPVDILEGRYVSLRFTEHPEMYPVIEMEPEPAPEIEPEPDPVDAVPEEPEHIPQGPPED